MRREGSPTMTLRLWWLTVAVLTAVVVTAVSGIVVIAGDGSARASAARTWPVPDAPRIVPMAHTTTPVPTPTPSTRDAPVTPKLAANSVAIPVQHVQAPVISYCPIIEGGLEPPSD